MTLKIECVILLLLLFSCKNSYKTAESELDEKSLNIDLSKYQDQLSTVPLSYVGKNVKYIPLETTTNSLIKKICQLCLSKSYIFISDFQRLLQFDMNGNFIRQIGANGRGPGEYINISGFCIDSKNEKVLINAWGIQTILEYDFNGKFIGSTSLPFSAFQFLPYDSIGFIFRLNHNKTSPDSQYKLYLTDRNLKPLYKFKNYFEANGEVTLVPSETSMYYFGNTLRFMQFADDTLFEINKYDIKPYAVFRFGNLKMNFHDLSFDEFLQKRPELNNKLWIYKILENEDFLFLTLKYGLSDSSLKCLIEKTSLKILPLKDMDLINDIDGGVNVWPEYIYNDSILIDYINAFDFKREIFINALNTKNIEKKKDLEFLEKSIKETDNPIIILINTPK